MPVWDSQENSALASALVAEMYLNKSVLLNVCSFELEARCGLHRACPVLQAVAHMNVMKKSIHINALLWGYPSKVLAQCFSV